ncbi:flagellar biosynthesis regulatory protein FlaF [Profundibacter amoris]|uniref:Flagellar biosynthesis regulatory protein FlaF n=2 Tax=Profundibacter amoris TaxID=2171755 RepID=A0A347UL90_9RHOB|nr:flagellar biosynthesis regulatory protein FlaF [Profundibacter amoris]
MNAFNMAKTAYANSSAPTRTPRSIEYDAFARITHRLKSASQGDSFTALAAALHENNKLWTLLAADVSDKDNALPESLRGRIFYLFEFTAQHGRKVLHKEASVDVLVDINTAIMRGLRSKEGVS